MRVTIGILCAVGLVGGAAWADGLRLGDGAAANRAAIQRAVDEASARGGGRVTIPCGTWPTGSIELKDGVELHLPKGATLKGSTDRADYNANDAFPENVWSEGEEWSGGHLVWGRGVRDVAITGEGVIDGSGSAFFGECDEDSRWPWYKYGLKLHPLDREWFRPGMMVAFFLSRNVRIEGVTLANTPAWTCHLRCCDGVTIRGVTIDADRTIANSDGFSIDCTRNVTVEKCVLRTGDDGFAIRASCALHPGTNFCENIRIRDCDVWSCCYGIRFGIGNGLIRNVEVADVRIHEASEAAFGFSPAWVSAAKNCYIENVVCRNCTASECVRPVLVEGAGGDYHVTGIGFEDCVFNTLLPMRLQGSDRCELAFVRCARNTIERFKVRHRWGWGEREIRNGRSDFAQIDGDRAKIRVVDCQPKPLGSAGVLLLSFGGCSFADWEAALPLFAEHGAHATFFVRGEFDAAAVRTAKRLMAGGHSIGLNGQRHADVPEVMAAKGANGYYGQEIATVRRRCDVAYVPSRSFAYPNGRRTDESDRFLLTRFDRVVALRGETGRRPLATDDRLFFPAGELPKRRLVEPVSGGEGLDEIVACIRRAGERKEVFALALPGADKERLRRILAAAKASGVAVLGLDELPVW